MNSSKFDQQIAINLVTQCTDGLCAVDAELHYVAWNSALARITGLSADEVLGRKVFDVFPFLENIGERDVQRRVFAGETVVTDPRPYSIPEKNKTGFFQGHY